MNYSLSSAADDHCLVNAANTAGPIDSNSVYNHLLANALTGIIDEWNTVYRIHRLEQVFDLGTTNLINSTTGLPFLRSTPYLD